MVWPLAIMSLWVLQRMHLDSISRPTKAALGDNCFVIYADAHVGDELLADAMRALHLKQGRVKFLGSSDQRLVWIITGPDLEEVITVRATDS